MLKRSIVISMIGLMLIAACAPAAAPATQPTRAAVNAPTAITPHAATQIPTVRPTATSAPSETPQPVSTATPTTEPMSTEELPTLTAELTTTVSALLPPTPTPDSSGVFGPAIEGVSGFPLNLPGSSQQLWAVHTYGLRDFFSDQKHFIMIYARTQSGWQKIAKYDLESADYLDPTGVTQIELEPTHIWLQVEGGVGAHGGCYTLLGLTPDGRALDQSASGCADNPGAGETRDVNGDGQLDVILNQTDSYVFCYACGLRNFRYQVLSWDGKELTEQTLQPIPDSAPQEVREQGNRAVALAQAGVWQGALVAANMGKLLTATDPIARWDGVLIKLHADAFKEQVDNQIYPLLGNVLYGDFAATLDLMRPLPTAELFKRDSTLIKGTMAEGWEDALSQWITTTTTSALTVEPNSAAAYFLRGWAEYIAKPTDPAALSDIEKAAELAPDEKLFSESAAFLK